MKLNEKHSRLLWLTLFTIAMAYLESAVVVYLRAIMYPDGFAFPLASVRPDIAVTEIIREAATIIMLLGAGYLGGRYFTERFAWFIYCFAVWDIFYYVFLKVLIDWPDSLMTWDVLFLIPVVWTGPVISPVMVSLIMILLAAVLLCYGRHDKKVRINTPEWILLIAGSIIVIIAFAWDYSVFLLHHHALKEILSPHGKTALFDLSLQYVPEHFPWIVFVLGEMFILLAIWRIYRRYSKEERIVKSEK